MMNWRNLVWWGGYASIGISLQAVLPGLDFLLPGLILAIQERKKAQFLWVAALFLLIQEGTGRHAVRPAHWSANALAPWHFFMWDTAFLKSTAFRSSGF